MFDVYLDDIRDAPTYTFSGTCCEVPCTEWVTVRKIEYMKELLQAGLVNNADLDHDMGIGETGYDLVLWMEQTGNFPKGKVTVHSANFVGKDAMLMVLARNKK